MKGIEYRITEVLRAHRSNECWWKCDGGMHWTENQHAAHVAGAVVAALGLRLTTSGQYATFGLQLTDEELDAAGFTYHRKDRP